MSGMSDKKKKDKPRTGDTTSDESEAMRKAFLKLVDEVMKLPKDRQEIIRKNLAKDVASNGEDPLAPPEPDEHGRRWYGHNGVMKGYMDHTGWHGPN